MRLLLLLRYYLNYKCIQRFVRYYRYALVDDTLALAAEMLVRSLKLGREKVNSLLPLILPTLNLPSRAPRWISGQIPKTHVCPS